MKVNRKKLQKVLAIAVLGLIYYFIVTLTRFHLVCPVYTVTRGHVKCPGCGMTHACTYMAELDVKSAFCYHPVALILAPFWVVCGVLWLVDKEKCCYSRVVTWISIVLLLGYFIFRNLPICPLY